MVQNFSNRRLYRGHYFFRIVFYLIRMRVMSMDGDGCATYRTAVLLMKRCTAGMAALIDGEI